MIKNGLLVMMSIFLTVLVMEGLFRLATDFPLNYTKNRVLDPDIGFRVATSVRGVDAHGFRNPPDLRKRYSLAAIGDSHTYGYNVESGDSWPSQFSRLVDIPMYNYGVGGNGIFSYHKLVMNELAKGKKVIVALYVGNDLVIGNSACTIDFGGDFWAGEVEVLDVPTHVFNKCGRDSVQISLIKKLKASLKFDVAVSSAFYWLLYKPYLAVDGGGKTEDLARGQTVRFDLHPALPHIVAKRVRRHHRGTDLAFKDTQAVYGIFERMLARWQERAGAGRLGILVVPSLEAVYERWLRQSVEGYDSRSEFSTLVQSQLDLELRLMTLFRERGIPAESISDSMVTLLDELVAAGEEISALYPDNGHPDARGYQRYAEVAGKLYQHM